MHIYKNLAGVRSYKCMRTDYSVQKYCIQLIVNFFGCLPCWTVNTANFNIHKQFTCFATVKKK